MHLNIRLNALLLTGLLMTATPHKTFAVGLVDLYHHAERHDASLSQSQYQKNAAEKSIVMTKSALMPSLTATGGISVSRHSEEMYDLNNLNAGINFLQLLYMPQTHTQVKQVHKQVSQASLNVQNSRQVLISRLVNTYFNVLKSKADLTLIENKLTSDRAQYERTSVSNEAGLLSQTDLLEAKSNMDATSADVISFQHAFDNYVEELENITGQSISGINALDILTDISPLPFSQASILSTLNQQNIAIQTDQLNVDSATDNITLQQQSNAPAVNLNVHYGYQHYDQYSDALAMQYKDRHRFEVGVQASMPLYDGGLKSARVSQAKIQQQEAMEKLRDTQEQIQLAVKQSLRNIKRNQALVSALHEAKRSSESFLEATEISYETGLRDLVDLLNARTANLRANRNLVAAQYDLIAEQIRLKSLMNELSIRDLQWIDSLLTESIALK